MCQVFFFLFRPRNDFVPDPKEILTLFRWESDTYVNFRGGPAKKATLYLQSIGLAAIASRMMQATDILSSSKAHSSSALASLVIPSTWW